MISRLRTWTTFGELFEGQRLYFISFLLAGRMGIQTPWTVEYEDKEEYEKDWKFFLEKASEETIESIKTRAGLNELDIAIIQGKITKSEVKL